MMRSRHFTVRQGLPTPLLPMWTSLIPGQESYVSGVWWFVLVLLWIKGFPLGSLVLPPSLRRNIGDFHRIWSLRAKQLSIASLLSPNLNQQSWCLVLSISYLNGKPSGNSTSWKLLSLHLITSDRVTMIKSLEYLPVVFLLICCRQYNAVFSWCRSC